MTEPVRGRPGPAAVASGSFTVGIVAADDIGIAELASVAPDVRTTLETLLARLPDVLVLAVLGMPPPAAQCCANALGSLPLRVSGPAAGAARSPDFIASRSQILVAIWNGLPGTTPGDPADVIGRFLGLGSDAVLTGPACPMAPDEDLPELDRLVVWIPAGASGQTPADEANRARILTAIGGGLVAIGATLPQAFLERLTDLNEFHRDFALLESGRGRKTGPARGLLAGDATAEEFADLKPIDELFRRADTLAGFMQRRSEQLFNLFGGMALAMGVAFLIYDKLRESRSWLEIYLAILVLSLSCYFLLNRKRWFGKHLAYRALAETLRVHFYLAAAGIDARRQSRELFRISGIARFKNFSWIELAFDSVPPPGPAGWRRSTLRDDFVDRHWITSQHLYYTRKLRRMRAQQSRVKRLRELSFAALVALLLAMLVYGANLHRDEQFTGIEIKNLLSFLSGVLAVSLGVWEYREGKMAVKELLWQYAAQRTRYERARNQLGANLGPRAREVILAELGGHSLMEVYLWTIHRYHREYQPPAGH